MSEPIDEEVYEAEIIDEPPQGRAWGTFVGRVLLVLLLIILAIEAHAKFGYDRTLTSLRASASKIPGEPVRNAAPELEEWSLPLPQAEKCISGFPSKRRISQFGIPIIVLKWLSLFKTYVIQLHLDDENTVVSLSTEDIE